MQRKYGLEASISSVLFIILFLVIVYQILGRTAVFDGAVWTEEAARWIWVWMALIAIGTVERDGAHLRMGFILELMPKKVQRVIGIITDLLYLGIAGHLVWLAWKTAVRTWDNTSVTLPVNDGVLYASAFAAMVIIVIRIALRLKRNLFGDASGEGTS